MLNELVKPEAIPQGQNGVETLVYGHMACGVLKS